MPEGKLSITKAPPLPSRCVVCYNDAKGNLDFVDFGASLDYYGAILICELCIVNVAELIGFIPVAKFELAEAQATTAINSHLAALKKVRILESFVAAYTDDPEFTLDSFIAAHSDLSLFGEVTGDSSDTNGSATKDQSGLTEPVNV